MPAQVPEIIGQPFYVESSTTPSVSRKGTAKQQTRTPSTKTLPTTHQPPSLPTETTSHRMPAPPPPAPPAPPPSAPPPSLPPPQPSPSQTVTTEATTSTATIQSDASTGIAILPGSQTYTPVNPTFNPSTTLTSPPSLTLAPPENGPGPEEEMTPSSPKSSIFAIIITVVGIAGLLAILGGIYFVFRHKRRRHRTKEDPEKRVRRTTPLSATSLKKETASGEIDQSHVHPSSKAPSFLARRPSLLIQNLVTNHADYNKQHSYSRQPQILPVARLENDVNARKSPTGPSGNFGGSFCAGGPGRTDMFMGPIVPTQLSAVRHVPSELTAENLAELDKPIQRIRTACTTDVRCGHSMHPQISSIFRFPLPPGAVSQPMVQHSGLFGTCSDYSDHTNHLQGHASQDALRVMSRQSDGCDKPIPLPPVDARSMIRYNIASSSHAPGAQSSATVQPPPSNYSGNSTTCLDASCSCGDDEECLCITTAGPTIISSALKLGHSSSSSSFKVDDEEDSELVTTPLTVASLEVHNRPPMTPFQSEADDASQNTNRHMSAHIDNSHRSAQIGAASNSDGDVSTSPPLVPDPGQSSTRLHVAPHQKVWGHSEYSSSEYTDHTSEAQFSSSDEALATDSHHSGSSTMHNPNHQISPWPSAPPLSSTSHPSLTPLPCSFQQFNRTPASEDEDLESTLTTGHIQIGYARECNPKAGTVPELERILEKRGFRRVSVEPKSENYQTLNTNARGGPGRCDSAPLMSYASYAAMRRTTGVDESKQEWDSMRSKV